jgi:hypothetical protein
MSVAMSFSLPTYKASQNLYNMAGFIGQLHQPTEDQSAAVFHDSSQQVIEKFQAQSKRQHAGMRTAWTLKDGYTLRACYKGFSTSCLSASLAARDKSDREELHRKARL